MGPGLQYRFRMRLLGLILGLSTAASATTLQKLTYDEMTAKSTEIVRGKVTATGSTLRGPVVYTTYRIQVSETLKGKLAQEVQVAVPGGRHGSLVQTLSGSPKLEEGQEYLLFLWTSSSGLTQVIGLSQGLFEVKRDAKGEMMITRAASGESLIDSQGITVNDIPVAMRYKEMTSQIERVLEAQKR